MNQTPPSTGLIPDELLSNVKKGDCVLFLGADLPLGYEGAPPSRPELAGRYRKSCVICQFARS